MFSLIFDVCLHSVQIVSMQDEYVYVEKKTRQATEYVAEKTMPAPVINACGYMAD